MSIDRLQVEAVLARWRQRQYRYLRGAACDADEQSGEQLRNRREIGHGDGKVVIEWVSQSPASWRRGHAG